MKGIDVVNFKDELKKLLDQEGGPLPDSELEVILAAERQLIQALNKKQSDISVQVEEIYDIVKDADNSALQEVLRDEKKRVIHLAQAVISLCDLIEDFYEYAIRCRDEELERQAALMRKSADGLIESHAITRIGEVGSFLDPEIHSVQAAEFSQLPREQIVKVLRSGYRHMGAIIRKAAVTVSKGWEEV